MRYVRYGALVGCAGSAWVQNRALMDARGGRYRVSRVVLGYAHHTSAHTIGVACARLRCAVEPYGFKSSFHRDPPRVLSRFPGSRPLHRLSIFLLLRVLFLISDFSRRRDARRARHTDRPRTEHHLQSQHLHMYLKSLCRTPPHHYRWHRARAQHLTVVPAPRVFAPGRRGRPSVIGCKSKPNRIHG